MFRLGGVGGFVRSGGVGWGGCKGLGGAVVCCEVGGVGWAGGVVGGVSPTPSSCIKGCKRFT